MTDNATRWKNAVFTRSTQINAQAAKIIANRGRSRSYEDTRELSGGLRSLFLFHLNQSKTNPDSYASR